MEYRNFTIQHNGWPGAEYIFIPNDYDGPEDSRAGVASDERDAKREIDQYYGERTHYRVTTPAKFFGDHIHKFDFWSEATEFCNKVGLDYMHIETYVLGEKINFDSI